MESDIQLEQALPFKMANLNFNLFTIVLFNMANIYILEVSSTRACRTHLNPLKSSMA